MIVQKRRRAQKSFDPIGGMWISKIGEEEHEGLEGSLSEELFDAGSFEVVEEGMVRVRVGIGGRGGVTSE